ncbi:hypothetical protein pb186bvf_000633 [Paramecium bursaria]
MKIVQDIYSFSKFIIFNQYFMQLVKKFLHKKLCIKKPRKNK